MTFAGRRPDRDPRRLVGLAAAEPALAPMSVQLFGLPVSRGVAIGRAVIVTSSRVEVDHYFVEPSQVDGEITRLREARDTVAAELTLLKSELPGQTPAELSALLDVHLMLLHDETLVAATKQWIIERRYNAEWALSAQLDVVGRQFDDMEDDYLRERKADIEQVVDRMLAVMRNGRGGLPLAMPGDGLLRGDADALVLVANDVSPADMMQFKRSVFRGFITDVGGPTSHTAIVARSLDIPAVVGAREASRLIRRDDWVIVDGDVGVVIVNPSQVVLDEYRVRQSAAACLPKATPSEAPVASITKDGVVVRLMANIESPGDTSAALAEGADGIGLYRSEFLFMNRNGSLPGEDEQYDAYRSAVEAMRGRPVTIRTIDIGADKPLDRLTAAELRGDHGLNPALGLRAIRWSLSEPGMFRQQLRAILRASAHGPVNLLVPMIAHLAEARQTIEALDRAKRQLESAGKSYGVLRIGAMIEVPAAALTLDRFLPYFDFISIGTNDLIQYTLAVDRADESVAHLYDPWHPAVLRLIAAAIAQANEAGKPVSVCGEMAGDPEFTEMLLGMGLRDFSMHPAYIAAVRERLSVTDVGAWAEQVAGLLLEAEPLQARTRFLDKLRAVPPAADAQVS